jgi:hypothetical protein
MQPIASTSEEDMTAGGGLFHVRLDSPPRATLDLNSALSTKSLVAHEPTGNLAAWFVALLTPVLPNRALTAVMVAILYASVRGLCAGGVECRPKSPRAHLNTLTSALILSEVLRTAAATVARAPRELSFTSKIAAASCCSACSRRCVRPPPWLRSLSFAALAFVSCGVLLGFSSISTLKNDLHSDAAWRPPALYAYVAGLSFFAALLVVAVLNAIADFRSRRVLCNSAMQSVLVGALCVGVALAIARRGDGGQPHDYTKATCLPTMHVHHWIISAFLFLLLALPTSWSFALVARALLFGLFISGIAAYGADGLLDSGLCPRA